jgi:aldehyde dehydrogenase (NAD+)
MSAISFEIPAMPAGKQSDYLFINGEWVAPSAPLRKIKIVSPINAAIFGEVAEATEPDIDRAVAAAKRAFEEGPWPSMPASERAAKLRQVAAALQRKAAAAAEAWTTQIGVPLWLTEAFTPAIINLLTINADIADAYQYEDVRSTVAPNMKVVVVRREPVGVVAAIAPWNAPLFAMLIKVAPALAAGCTVVAKPAPESPLETYLLAEAIEEAGLPPGVFNLVCADREASDHLVRHPDVNKVTFTGSTAVGRRIAEVCAQRLARATMELGGKSAAIVLDDMPAEEVAGVLAPAITMMCGQVCANLTRILVPRHREKEYTEAIAAAMAGTVVGNPLSAGVMMGPLAMKRQMDRVKGYVDKGLQEGARIATGGRRADEYGPGYFFQPTVFSNVTNGMSIAQEEIFGPVTAVIPYDSEDDAVRLANASIYGLSGAVFTRDTDRAYTLAKRLRTGNLSQNGHGLDMTIPFGGFKQSGYGREGGVEGFEAYLEVKAIFLPRLPSHLS